VNVINIVMPSLRDRKDDIDLLADYFVGKYSRANNKNVKTVSDEVRKMFLLYHWPGNIRELENAIEGAVVMCRTDVINRWDVPNAEKFSLSAAKPLNGQSLKKVLEQPEKDRIEEVLSECNWNRNWAAAILGINRTTLYNKMKKYNISFSKP
jgi:transcriptional regulator with PAS, ATPase and Fis domain